ncbi:MAG TPA: efflux RND transporter periplasmic adaptor subunit [Planctomycetota bacterium]|nr:efflux RND transporter periplasmic adaptor subunit [Planctomycetota bacterium]
MDLSRLTIERTTPPSAGRGARRRRPAWIVPVVVVAVLGGAGFLFRTPLLAGLDRFTLPEVEVAIAVKSSPLSAGAIEGTAANGYVVADRRAALSADTPGRIVELNVREGSFVKKGEVVARLYADEYKAALARALAEVAAQKTTVLRAGSDLVVAQSNAATLQTTITAAQANVDTAEATFKQATQKLERAQKMVEDKVENQQALDDARAEHDRAVGAKKNAEALLATAQASAVESQNRVASAQAVVDEAQAQLPAFEAARDLAQATLDKTEVRAPFTGIVVLKDAEVGEVVSPNAQGAQSRGSVATMVDFESLQVQVEMPERNIGAVEVGAPVKIFLDALPDQPYSGKVERVWPTANRTKATIEVRASFEKLDERLRPEMGVRVVFLPKGGGGKAAASVPFAEGVFVPASCVVRDGGTAAVFVVERGVVHKVALTLGEPKNERYLVEKGLAGGEQLVVKPPARLEDGDHVRVKE